MRTAAELTAYRYGKPSPPRRFALEGTVTKATALYLMIEDASGVARIANILPAPPKSGDRLKASGWAEFNEKGDVTTFRDAVFSIIGHCEPPPPKRLALGKVDEADNDLRLIETEGIVVDSFRDEIDPSNDILILREGGVTMPVSVMHGQLGSIEECIDARLRVTGFLSRQPIGLRKVPGPMITCEASSNLIEVVSPAPSDRFARPAFNYDAMHTPRELASLGKRTTIGTVLAVWQNSMFMILSDDGRHVSNVELVCSVAPPACGARVQVVGYPATDLYNINFTHGIFRNIPSKSSAFSTAAPERIAAESLLTDEHGQRRLAISYHGKLVTLRGIVSSTRSPMTATSVFNLDCGHVMVPVDTGSSGLPPDYLQPGSEIEITGICVMTGDNWRTDRPFPQHDGFTIVMRTNDDLKVISCPPWWTPGKMLVAIVGLLLIILVSAFWNYSLIRLAAKRGKQLFDEQIEHACADLRVEERTRLAVELHDSLSQNLEGIAYLLAAGRGKVSLCPNDVERNLATAERMLHSSRTELKRCLFDLRHDALEERDFAAALRKSCEPIAGDAALTIRFCINREHMSDSTAHAVICIVRELVSNAVAHGRARHVRIAGDYRDGLLKFSVRDDGNGFSPDMCKGPGDGHFGLSGIRSRVKRFGGVFTIESAIGGPTRASVTVAIVRPKATEE